MKKAISLLLALMLCLSLCACDGTDSSDTSAPDKSEVPESTAPVSAGLWSAEKMVDEKTGQPYTAHTVGKVQAVLVNDQSGVKALDNGCLADIAPTMLTLLELPIPEEMTGKSLIK